MKFLPIVERELRVTARRRGTYWWRSGMALLVLLASAWILLLSRDQPPNEIGPILFYVLSGGALAVCIFSGTIATADCLSEEKREGTLGLLFLTDLKGYDVVLGKLVANSLGSFYGLLAIVPMLGLPLLMGGVAPGEFGRVASVLLDTLMFSLTAGMLCSAISRSARKALGGTILIILLFTAGVPALGAWLEWVLEAPTLHTPFLITSPVFCYTAAVATRWKAGGDGFYASLAVLHGLSWLFFVLSSIITPRSWRDKSVRARENPLWRAAGDAPERRTFRTHLLDRNPFYWLAARSRFGPAFVWSAFATLAVLWFWGAYKFKNDWFSEGIYVATALVANTVLKLWVAGEACRPLSEERRNGSLELLLTTRLSIRQILEGHRLAILRQFLWVVVLLVVLEILMLASGARMIGRNTSETETWVTIWSLGLVLLLADLVALFWVGMWMGLAARNPKRAFSHTVVRVLVLPWIGYAAFLMAAALAEILLHASMNWKTFVAMWFVIGVAADVGFGLLAWRRLTTGFRALAMERYQPTGSFLRQWFGGK